MKHFKNVGRLSSPFSFSIVVLLFLLLTGCSDDRYILDHYHETPVYSENNEKSIQLGSLQPGQRARLVKEEWSGWFKILYNGNEGYVNSNVEIVDGSGEKLWFTKSFFRGVGIGIAVVAGIGIGIAVISFVFAAVSFLIGLLLKIITVVVPCAIFGWVIGYFVTHDFDGTVKWIIGASILGLVISIVSIIKNPASASSSGWKKASETYNDMKKKEAERKAEEERRRDQQYPYEIDGVRAEKMLDGSLRDEKGNTWIENEDGTYTKE